MFYRVNYGLFSLVAFCALVIILYYRSDRTEVLQCSHTISKNVVSPGSTVVYNRIPKTGSTTLTNALAYDLCEENHFHVIHLNLTRNRYMMSPLDQGVFVRNVSEWTRISPAFYHGHVAYIDFSRFGYRNPIYINMVREPFERFLSYYYFLRYGDNFRVGLKRRKSGNNETLDECLQRNGRDCDPKALWLQIPYFCGTASFCSDVGSDRALETAKRNLIERYLLVGLTERMEDTIAALEKLLPSFFNGAADHFKELNKNRSHLRHTQKKIAPTAQTIQRIKENRVYKMEREFYDFAAREFDGVYRRLTDVTEGEEKARSRPQFHYEKIKPSI